MPFIIHQRIELRSANAPLIYQQEMELGDRYAHQWRVTPMEGGVPADLTGAAVSAFFRRADGSMLSVSGTIDEGDAVVLLPAGAYSVEGFADGVMRIAVENGLTALAQLRYRVARHSSDTIVDPDHVIPDISELLAQIETMRAGTAAANTAAADANTAAGEAYDAATAANESAAYANTAAAGANAAAGKLGGMTASAEQLPASQDPVVSVRLEDGHYVLHFGIPDGDPGPTPRLTIGTVQTLPEGSQATATITGTAENPVLNLGIPQGRTGSAEGVYATNVPMSTTDPTTVAEAIEAAGKVETVAGVGVAAGTKNVPLKGSNLPMSASDPTTVAQAIAAAGKVETVAGVAVEEGTKNVPLKGSDLPMSASDPTKVAEKIGSGALETDAQDLTGAVNELVGDMDTLDGAQIPMSASDSTKIATAITKSIHDAIEVTLPNVSDSNRSFYAAGITASHELIQDGCAYVETPSAVGGNLTLETRQNAIFISGTLTGTTTIKATFCIKGTKVSATAYADDNF